MVPTLAASLVIERLSPGHDVTAALADGSMTGTVAFASAPLGEAGGRVSGVLEQVPAGAAADVVVAPVEGDRWVLLRTTDAEVTPVTSVDLTRPVAGLTVDGAVADELGGGAVLDLVALVLAAEAVGVAAWCVDTTAEYAAERVQFGRPIGQFQGVKHRLADMLADLELARAAVWDAARGGPPDETGLAIASATALAVEAAYRIAKDAVQLHGGIGFTWEHDCHRYLRRAMSTRALLPDVHHWRARLVADLSAGVTRSLPVELPPEADEVRAEVRDWLEQLTARPSGRTGTTRSSTTATSCPTGRRPTVGTPTRSPSW